MRIMMRGVRAKEDVHVLWDKTGDTGTYLSAYQVGCFIIDTCSSDVLSFIYFYALLCVRMCLCVCVCVCIYGHVGQTWRYWHVSICLSGRTFAIDICS